MAVTIEMGPKFGDDDGDDDDDNPTGRPAGSLGELAFCFGEQQTKKMD